MEVINKIHRHNKTVTFKKNINPLYLSIEEYAKIMDIIPKEVEKNKEINSFEETISNIYEEINNAIIEFYEKMRQISKKLNPNDNDNEGKLQKIINNILVNGSDALENIAQRFENDKENNKIYTDYYKKLEEFYKKVTDKIDDYDKKRKLYLEEVSKYEAYLVNKVLGLLESKNENENNKKENKKKKDKNITLENNHLKVIETQENYVAFKNDLIFEIKKIIGCINTERKLVYNLLKQNTESLFKNINMGLANINGIIAKGVDFYENNPIKDNENLINEEETINTIFKDEIYSFKFLTIHQENEKIEEDTKNKKKKKDNLNNINIDSLVERLEDENIRNLIKILKNNDIKYNIENEKKITILEDKKKAENFAKFIITEPENFNDDKKNELIKLLKENVNNQKGFIQFLNNFRANGIFELKELTITILCDLFTIIVELAVKNHNYKIIQIILILSLTYYHHTDENKTNISQNLNIESIGEEEDNNRVYMTKYLKKSKPFHEKDFWLNYLEALINEENEKLTKRKEITINEKQKSVAAYSSVFTLIKNMIDYDSDFVFINTVLEDVFKIHKFSDSNKSDIVNFLMVETEEKKKIKNK